MAENSPSTLSSKGSTLRIGVIVFGALVFILLFFADKTNLNNQPGRMLDGQAATSESSNALPSGKLPPLAADPQTDQMQAELEGAEGEARKELLGALIGKMQERNRLDYAAVYADDLASIDRSLPNLLQAGLLYQQASRLDYISNDTSLFGSYSEKAIAYLSQVVEADGENEEALYHLGMAYVESRNPQNSMQGILTIRKVLEINPDNTEAGFSLGMFSVQTGQFEKAEQRFQKVLDLQPDNYAAKYYLAYSRVEQDKKDQVNELLQDVVQHAKDPELKQMARNLINNI